MVSFVPGNTYTARSVCDHNCVISTTIASRTAKTVTTSEGKRFRVSVWRDVEQFMPWGTYSMAPIMTAEKVSK